MRFYRIVFPVVIMISLVFRPDVLFCQGQNAEGEYETKEKVVILEYKKLYNEGLKSYREKDYRQALQNFQKSVDLEDDFIEGYNGLGLAHYKLNNFDAALEAFQKSLSLNPEQHETYFNMGKVYEASSKKDKSNIQKAIASYENVLKLKDDYAPVYKNLGIIYEKQGSNRKAIDAYKNAIANEKRYRTLNLQLSILLNKEDRYEEAKRAIVEYLKVKPGSAAGRVTYGEILENLGDFNEAVAQYRKAINDRTWGETAKYKIEVLKEAGKISG
jgi:tetratricopeptide (TPR) repeat protein